MQPFNRVSGVTEVKEFAGSEWDLRGEIAVRDILSGATKNRWCISLPAECMSKQPNLKKLQRMGTRALFVALCLLERASRALNSPLNDLSPMVKNMARLYFGIEQLDEKRLLFM